MAHRIFIQPDMRFGRLVVKAREPDHVYPSGKRRRRWRLACDCGHEVVALGNNLTSGNTASCGCLKDELTVERSSLQGGYGARVGRHPLYEAWRSMHRRCYNPNDSSYPHYGGRGIGVCARWAGPGGFVNFLEDMGERPADPPGWSSRRSFWSLDRIDNDGNYEPDNCRWATPSEQMYNQRPGIRRRSK